MQAPLNWGVFVRGSNLNKRWVFESLVKDDKDTIGLIAYALYKHKKHTLAKSLRKEGRDEQYIQAQVDTFHDQTLQNGSLEDYREKAKSFLSQIFKEVENEIEAHLKERFEREKAQLQKLHKKDLANTKRDLLEKIKNYPLANRPWWKKAGEWLLSGMPSVVSSFLITSLIIGASVLFVSKEKRQEILRSLSAEYLGVPQQPSTASAEPRIGINP